MILRLSKKMIILIKHDAGIFFSILKESLRLQGNSNQHHCLSDYSINCQKRKLCFQNHESSTCLNKLKLWKEKTQPKSKITFLLLTYGCNKFRYQFTLPNLHKENLKKFSFLLWLVRKNKKSFSIPFFVFIIVSKEKHRILKDSYKTKISVYSELPLDLGLVLPKNYLLSKI